MKIGRIRHGESDYKKNFELEKIFMKFGDGIYIGNALPSFKKYSQLCHFDWI